MHSRSLSFIVLSTAVAVTILSIVPGCSNDGGFFPGTVNHNEGAVDYRIAPLGSPSNSPNGTSHTKHKLSGDGSMPYISLADAGQLGTFSRTKTPEPLIQADVQLGHRERELMDAQTVLRSDEKTLADYQVPLDTAKKDLMVVQEEIKNTEANITALREKANTEQKDLTPENLTAALNEQLAKKAELAKRETTLITTRDGFQRSYDAQSARVTAGERAVQQAIRAVEEAKSFRDAKISDFENEKRTGTAVQERIETVRVTLKQAYLRDFTEPGNVGEVAILMTVKESRSGLGQTEPKSGRVVYYSEGARKHAFMNFRDQPVYGPIRYGGDDLHIRISVIELDERDNAVAGGILKTLATIGSIAYPPSSPVLAALDQIGSSLLTLNGPDLEWDYLMRLSSRPAEESYNSTSDRATYHDAWLRDGYYILMRSDPSTDSTKRARISDAEWNALFLDPRSGVVYQKSENDQYTEYSQRSYLVFTVQTGFDSTQLDLGQETAELSTIIGAYGAGSESLSEAAEASARALRKALIDAQDRRNQKLRKSAGQR